MRNVRFPRRYVGGVRNCRRQSRIIVDASLPFRLPFVSLKFVNAVYATLIVYCCCIGNFISVKLITRCFVLLSRRVCKNSKCCQWFFSANPRNTLVFTLCCCCVHVLERTTKKRERKYTRTHTKYWQEKKISSDLHGIISTRQTFTKNLSQKLTLWPCLSALYTNLFNVYDNRNEFVDFVLTSMCTFNSHGHTAVSAEILTFSTLTEMSKWASKIQREISYWHVFWFIITQLRFSTLTHYNPLQHSFGLLEISDKIELYIFLIYCHMNSVKEWLIKIVHFLRAQKL